MNTVGLDPHVCFLHWMNPGKDNLAYDLKTAGRF
ncbi:CRISPR-associated endonuclease Cas1 [Methanomethylovorans sp.]